MDNIAPFLRVKILCGGRGRGGGEFSWCVLHTIFGYLVDLWDNPEEKMSGMDPFLQEGWACTLPFPDKRNQTHSIHFTSYFKVPPTSRGDNLEIEVPSPRIAINPNPTGSGGNMARRFFLVSSNLIGWNVWKFVRMFFFHYPTKYGNKNREFQIFGPSSPQRKFDPKI